MNLAQTVLGVTFLNPTVLASGPMGIVGSGWKEIVRQGAGGITTKSIWLTEHRGHANPTIIATDRWTLNAVGLAQAGIDAAKPEIEAYLADRPAPLILNIVSDTIEGFAKTAAAAVKLHPDFLEINISCPNVEDQLGRPFACSVTDAAAVTKAVKKSAKKVPVFIKLSPNVDDIKAIARACATAGADGFTVINTAGPGMAIDLRSRLPILSNKVGGLSGPSIKPIAVRCVADVFAATEGKFPIIGTGGVASGEDAIEMLLAGASLVGIGTAIWERGIDVFRKVCEEMQLWCTNEGVNHPSELVGGMHRAIATSDSRRKT